MIGLLEDLHTKATGDAAAELEAFNAYAEWCKEQAQDDGHQHETLSADIASTKADDAAKAESTGSDVSPLADGILSADREVTAAKAVKEAKDVSKSEAVLVNVVDTLQRAISFIQKEMAKNNDFFLGKEGIDTQYMNRVVAPLTAVVDAAAFLQCGQGEFVALVQTDNQATMMSMSCPVQWPRHNEATAQTSLLCSMIFLKRPRPSSARIDTLSRTHATSLLFKQSLEDQLAPHNKDLEKAKANEAEFTTSLELGAEAEKSLAALVASQAASKSSCVQVASDHDASVKAFAEELKALADAKQAARQERAPCRIRSARLAHFRKHDVWF